MGQAKRRGTFEERKAKPLGFGYRTKLGSRFYGRVASHDYNPPKKAPSRRDRHRMDVAERKAAS